MSCLKNFVRCNRQCSFDFAQFWYGFTKSGRVEQVLSNKWIGVLFQYIHQTRCVFCDSLCVTQGDTYYYNQAHFRCFDTHWAADYNRRLTRRRRRLHAKAKPDKKLHLPTSQSLDSHSTGKPQVLCSASMYCYLVSKLLIVSTIIQVLIIIVTSEAWIIKVQKRTFSWNTTY